MPVRQTLKVWFEAVWDLLFISTVASHGLNWGLENSDLWLKDCSVPCVQMKRRGAVLYQSPTYVRLDGVRYHTFFRGVIYSAFRGKTRRNPAKAIGLGDLGVY